MHAATPITEGLGVLALAFALAASMAGPVPAAEEPPPGEGVSRELARQRAARIAGVRYRLSLDVRPGAARLEGREEVSFRLQNGAGPVVLDFRDLDPRGKVIEGSTRNVSVNGRPADAARQANGHIVLPAALFRAGENRITLGFDSAIAPAGGAVTRYVDKDDGGEYVYTLLVPMDASLAFPCFDQPDLKARFALEVNAPEPWTVVANGAVEERRPSKEPRYRHTRFAETPPISTYLFAFAAGPFRELRGKGGPVPLRLLVRQSKLGRAKEEWPEVERTTRDGMRHLAAFFDQPFPFSKYDQVLLPGFAYGGMEHAEATFLREESILFRTVPTRGDHLRRASLVLHELSHQWFGDLVTMEWFDDLWLKEGFAEYMAYHAMTALYPADEVWKRFYEMHKPPAYAIDATQGTTPIYQEVPNLKDAKSAYGAIVYSKAPGLLRSLAFLVGEDSFRDGLRLYLQQHAFGNARWADLVRALEAASGRRLGPWADAWIRQRGMPEVTAGWEADERGRIRHFTLRQRDVLGEGHTWPVRTQVLLAYEDAPAVRLTVDLDGAEAAVPEAVGRRRPDYVFANDRDYGYGRFLLDEHSRAAVARRAGKVPDPFLRSMLWGALWDAVREAQWAPSDYVALALGTLPAEGDEELTRTQLARVTRAFLRYLSDLRRQEAAPRIEKLCWEAMMHAPDRGLRITYFRALLGVATTADGRARLKELLAGKASIPSVPLKPLDRWEVVRGLLARGDGDAEALFASEREHDLSDEARKYAYVARAARPDAATKRRYFDDYLHARAVPEDWVEASLGAFNDWNQAELTRPYLKPALEALPQVKRERKIFFLLAWLNAFIGGQRDRQALAVVRAFLGTGGSDADLRRKVLEVVDELERTVRIREKFPD